MELTEEQQAQFDKLISSGKLSVDQLHEVLLGWGYEISRSSTGRYKKRIDAVSEGIRKSRQVMDALTDQFGDQFANSKQGEVLTNTLRVLVFECMTGMMEEDEKFDPKGLSLLSKAIKDAASAMRLDQDYENKVRETIVKEERERAAETVSIAVAEAGLSKTVTDRIKKDILGIE